MPFSLSRMGLFQSSLAAAAALAATRRTAAAYPVEYVEVQGGSYPYFVETGDHVGAIFVDSEEPMTLVLRDVSVKRGSAAGQWTVVTEYATKTFSNVTAGVVQPFDFGAHDVSGDPTLHRHLVIAATRRVNGSDVAQKVYVAHPRQLANPDCPETLQFPTIYVGRHGSPANPFYAWVALFDVTSPRDARVKVQKTKPH